MPSTPILENAVKSSRHTSFFLSAGENGTPIIFVHGWPELSISWRHQLPVFAGLGFRAIAPDMRGYGRSSTYARHDDYSQAQIVADMIELIDHVGLEKAVWVGHDWGAVTVWSIAQQHPERCHGIANLCVPYIPEGFAPATLIPLADRSIYPEDRFPAAQWDYQLFYEESFAAAQANFEASIRSTVKAAFRAGDPSGKGKPAATAFVRANKGRAIPDLPRDERVLSLEDENAYTSALERTGFFGAGSWYMNAAANMAFARNARAKWQLKMPVLFLHASFDHVCESIESRLGEPMRRSCSNLTEVTVPSGHWMAQEKPLEVNAALARWLAVQLPDLWAR